MRFVVLLSAIGLGASAASQREAGTSDIEAEVETRADWCETFGT